MAYVFDNNIPLYLQVIDIIKKKIVAGVYQPGQQLEPVRALAGEYEINPNTIQRALQELENQNLVFSQRTRGRFVTDNLDLIKEERYKMSQVLIRESIEALYSLGFDKEDIVEAYKKILFEEEYSIICRPGKKIIWKEESFEKYVLFYRKGKNSWLLRTKRVW